MLNLYFNVVNLVLGAWLSLAGYRHIEENGITIMGVGLLLSFLYGWVVVPTIIRLIGDIK